MHETVPFLPAMAIVATLLSGCSTDGMSGSYNDYSVYQVDGSKVVNRRTAELVLASSVAASSAGKYDKPVTVLRAPQPVMPLEDTMQGVVGNVVVDISFNELGNVQDVAVVSSSKDSLLEAVLRVVRLWQIAPVTQDGKPQKITARQSFAFRPGR
jgi:TonB family protein